MKQWKKILVIGCFGAAVLALSLFVLERRALRSDLLSQDDIVLESEAEVARVKNVVSSEAIILEYTPKLKLLTRDVLNLEFPGTDSRGLFVETPAIRDISRSSPVSGKKMEAFEAEFFTWPVDREIQPVASSEFPLWDSLQEHVRYWKHARFYFIEGDFSMDGQLWESKVGFTGLAKLKSGYWGGVDAKQTVTWWREGEGIEEISGSSSPVTDATSNGHGSPSWRIKEWRQDNLEMTRFPRFLFEEVLGSAIPDSSDLQRARRSLHEEFIVKREMDGGFQPPHPAFVHTAFDRHPGLAVVDIDSDGWDDLYVMPRWGKNQLLRNQGDGTFVDIATTIGLDFESHCSAACFADFDNDGDVDVFLGRTLLPSLFLRNDSGVFVEQSSGLPPLPAFTVSVSAADYNRDGLLDVFFSTYAAQILAHRQHESSRSEVAKETLGQLMNPDDLGELDRLSGAKSDFVSRRIGPPNVLLVNRGACRFDVSPQSEKIAGWRNSFQGTWADYDNDGDMDLYVANDFSFDHLFRNDLGEFVDVTEGSGTQVLGFGMGVSWGDYDHDGRQDLYVTNMYSKAGRRILARLDGLVSSEVPMMARGNSLFYNVGDSFEKVSGLSEPSMLVEKAGWSWGAQWADFDNDGFLDIYALSGFYTAPRQIAADVDL